MIHRYQFEILQINSNISKQLLHYTLLSISKLLDKLMNSVYSQLSRIILHALGWSIRIQIEQNIFGVNLDDDGICMKYIWNKLTWNYVKKKNTNLKYTLLFYFVYPNINIFTCVTCFANIHELSRLPLTCIQTLQLLVGTWINASVSVIFGFELNSKQIHFNITFVFHSNLRYYCNSYYVCVHDVPISMPQNCIHRHILILLPYSLTRFANIGMVVQPRIETNMYTMYKISRFCALISV